MSFLTVALNQKKTLLIGAGAVASQKAMALHKVGYRFDIQSLEILDDYFLDYDVKIAPFVKEDGKSYEVIIDATGDEKVLQELLQLKNEKSFLLNVVDNPPYCDFYFTALISNDKLQIGVSSSGASPSLAQVVRDKIEKILPSDLTPTVKLLEELRTTTKDKKILKQTAQSQIGKVFLIGCGTGDLGNLTLEALWRLEVLDVALVDALAGEEVLSLLPKDCIVVDVGKHKGDHSKTQSEINKLLVQYAKKGLIVGRLKGGDPFLFGRLKEECDILKENGIEYEIINGISSVFKSFSVAKIIPTIRGVSSGVSVVSAHLQESLFNDNWIELLKNRHHTVMVLMAYSFAEQIKQSALKAGVNSDLPAMFVSNIDQKNEKVAIGTLETLEQLAQQVSKPAILVFGDVINYRI